MSTKSWWSRTDNRLLEAALGLAALLDGVFGVLLPALGVVGLIDPVDTREVRTETATRVPGTVTDAVAGHGMTLTGTHRADLAFAHPDLGQRLLLALPDVVGGLLLLLVLVLLTRMAGTLRDGDVFVPRNARRLSVIGLTVLVQAVLSPTLPAFTTQALVSGTPMAEQIPLSVTFTGEYVLLAFLILSLGEVFRRGTKLRADTEGLV
ncbi:MULTISPECIES: DUF2975 domain-containing protein [unclassified Streptomyces]|uniref:DUF2975 domain-containing protein n=1 Tax=unclassified Streptomyces TaxID=2593676 RepID=UPI00190D3F19|nr:MULTISPECIES: DUF2975 domain-containing protein [unclassified Streptomyces]MBK3563085.1 DUF2975 domain-containing protein [Streptomyces sp. MBT62]MBK6014927.1 DUF2975 domain-containing protein [Streptomyces sp. MBT53]